MMYPHQIYAAAPPQNVHVHQILCACPYPHINPFWGPMSHYMANMTGPPAFNNGFEHYQNSRPMNTRWANHASHPPFIQQNTALNQTAAIEDAAEYIVNDSDDEQNDTLMGREKGEQPIIVDPDTGHFIRFLEAGCLEAEKIAIRNRNHSCFANIQNLCQRTIAVLSTPSNTMAKIQAQGVPCVTKDFIYAYMHLINCWRLVRAYMQMQESNLGSIEHEFNREFRTCYAQWEDSTKNLAGHILRIFTNLDNYIDKTFAGCSGFDQNQMMSSYQPVPPHMNLQFQSATAIRDAMFPPLRPPGFSHNNAWGSRQQKMESGRCAETGSQFSESPRTNNLRLHNQEKSMLLDLDRCAKRKTQEQKFKDVQGQGLQASWPTANLNYRSHQTENTPYFLPLINTYNPGEIITPPPRCHTPVGPTNAEHLKSQETWFRCVKQMLAAPRNDPQSVKEFNDFCEAMDKSVQRTFSEVLFDGKDINMHGARKKE